MVFTPHIGNHELPSTVKPDQIKDENVINSVAKYSNPFDV